MTKRKEQQPKYKQSETVVIKRSQINFAPYNPRKEDPEVIKKLKKNFKTVGYLGGSLFLPPNLLNIKCKLRWLSRKIAY